MKKNKHLVPALIVFSCITFSCQKEGVVKDNPIVDSSTDSSLLKTLYEVGVKPSAIEDKGVFYVVGGDIGFRKHKTDLASVKRYFASADNKGPKTEQYASSVPFQEDEMRRLRVGVTGSVSVAWQSAVYEAMAQWANIPGTYVNFVSVNDASQAGVKRDIEITDDGGLLADDVLALTTLADGALNGFRIIINTDYKQGMALSASTKVYNMVRELGLCIGLRHSNWQALGEPAPAIPLLAGTPAADPNSVMNGGTSLTLGNWNGFSAYDIIALQTLWGEPEPYVTYPYSKFSYQNNEIGPYIFSTGNPMTITWNNSLITSNSVQLAVYQNGVAKWTIASNAPNTGSFTTPDFSSHLDGGRYNFLVQIRVTPTSGNIKSYFSTPFYIVIPD